MLRFFDVTDQRRGSTVEGVTSACSQDSLEAHCHDESPIFDFSHLTPEERIQLAEELWDSLEPEQLPVSDELGAELDRRVERHRQDPGRGRPAEDVLRDIEKRGR